MGNGPAATSWGRYVDYLRNRPGWSMARLARQADMNPATLFEYVRKDSGENVAIKDILRVAIGGEDDPVNAFRAAAGLTADDPEDEEIAVVLASNLPDDGKAEIIESILARRARDRARRMEDTVQMIRLAEGAEKRAS